MLLIACWRAFIIEPTLLKLGLAFLVDIMPRKRKVNAGEKPPNI